MTGSAVPNKLRRFVLANALTIPDIEALLIFRASRDSARDAADLAARLYVSETRAINVIEVLISLGAIVSADEAARYRYAPKSPDLAAVLDLLETVYTRHLVEMTTLVHATEAKAAQDFADAFRIRKET